MPCTVVALCHFCELHGPRVLFTSEVRFTDPASDFQQQRVSRPLSALSHSGTCWQSVSDSCEGCVSMEPSVDLLCTRDLKLPGRWYCSHQYSNNTDIADAVRSACARSLSCEVQPDSEGVMYFGDNIRGHIVSCNFALDDVYARGHQRRYSLLAMASDGQSVLGDLNFICASLFYISRQLKLRASKVFRLEHGERDEAQRNFQLFVESERHIDKSPSASTKATRSLQEITDSPEIFHRLHRMFSYLLFSSLHRFSSSKCKSLANDTTPVLPPLTDNDGAAVRRVCLDVGVIRLVNLIRSLYERRLDQIVVRTNNVSDCRSVTSALALCLPTFFRTVSHSPDYLSVSECDILGVAMDTIIDQTVCNIGMITFDDTIGSWRVEATPTILESTNQNVSAQFPTLFAAMVSILSNSNVPDFLLKHRLSSLRSEWMGKSRIFGEYLSRSLHPSSASSTICTSNQLSDVTSVNGVTSQQLCELLSVIGAKTCDIPLLTRWCNNPSV